MNALSDTTSTLSPDELEQLHAYWCAANYLSAGQIYLLANPLLKEPLTLAHIKPRLLGHIIKAHDLNMIYVAGPGHGGPALVANTWLEGSYSEVYPNVSQDAEGMRRLFKQFSFPGGVPSHVAPETPGSIHEGGELGYALSHAYGAVFDNPSLIAACVVGDGEAETGPLAAAWHSNKFLNPATDGAVLPILHLNGYKIANPTVLARISHEELFDESGVPLPIVTATAPSGCRRMGANLHANGGVLLKNLRMPDYRDYAVEVPAPGAVDAEATRVLGSLLRDVMLRNERNRNFRVFGPDDSMFNQHAKWLKVTSQDIPWRRPIASLNYLLTSHVWRQDHNGFSHQDPGFIDHVVNKNADVIRVFLPPDANTLLCVADWCLRSRDFVNVIVAGKQPQPQWLDMDAAIKHCSAGVGIWSWASNDQRAEPDVVMACAGDIPTLETLAAVAILREQFPELKIRVVNVVDLMTLQPKEEHPHGLSDSGFDTLFTTDKPVIFAYHGYPWLIHRLTYRRNNHKNLHVRGYKEEGATTTPFDMTVRNDIDRFHLVGDVIERVPSLGHVAAYARQLIRDKLIEHRQYINEFGEDMPEIQEWRWPCGDTSPTEAELVA